MIELKLKKGSFNDSGMLVKLGDMQKYVDPQWKNLRISEFYYHKIELVGSQQEIYLLDKHHYTVGAGWNQNPPTKLIRHKNGDITLKATNMKTCVGVIILY